MSERPQPHDDWTAGVRPGPDGALSEAQRLELRDRHLAALARAFRLSPGQPVPALREWVSPADAPATLAACLRGKGWHAAVVGDGVRVAGLRPDQERAERLARWECEAEHSLDPRAHLPLGAEQVRRLHAFYARLVPRLEDAGVRLPELPPVDEFLVRYGTERAWNPTVFLADRREELAAARAAGPLVPSLDELWGPAER